MIRRRNFVVVLALVVAACSRRAPNDSTAASIHGDDDMLTVTGDGQNLPAAYRTVLDAIGNVQTACTVTHLGGGYALTAGHCVDSNAACAAMRIYWGDRLGESPYLVSSCRQIVKGVSDEQRDFALIKVFPVPRAKAAVEWNEPLTSGEELTLLSHPEMLPLIWSQDCKAVSVAEPHFIHDCDTLGGSSGSALLRRDNAHVVGVHNTSDGGATGLAAEIKLFKKAIEAGGVAAAPVFPGRIWQESATGSGWQLRSLATARDEAAALCAEAGSGWQLASEAEIEAAMRHGLRDGGRNPAFGAEMALLDRVWVAEGQDLVNGYTLTTNHSDMERLPVVCRLKR